MKGTESETPSPTLKLCEFTKVIFRPIKRLKVMESFFPDRWANFYSVMSRENLTVLITDFLLWCSRTWTWWRFKQLHLRTSQELDFCWFTTSKNNSIEVPSHFPANAIRFPLCAITLLPKHKIVPALWLAVRSVCMRVCKHGCDV